MTLNVGRLFRTFGNPPIWPLMARLRRSAWSATVVGSLAYFGHAGHPDRHSAWPAWTLGFLWRPAVSLGAGAAHQRGPFGIAQAVGRQEGLDGLLVVDNSERARPVGAPQAAV